MKAPLHIRLSWKHLLCVSFLSPGFSSAITLSFGPLGGPSAPITGSGGITYTTTTISGGTANPGTHTMNSGSVTNVIGTSTYNGTFFDPAVDGDSTLTTLISASPRSEIDNGAGSNYANYIGLRVEFSAPIPMYAFGFIDIDGREWSSSFAYNSTGTGMTLTPTVMLGSGSPELTSTTTSVSWGGLTGAPVTNPVVVSDNGGHAPHDPESQIVYDYGGASITELYFLFGGNNIATATTTQNSGVTGFVVIEANPVVPEPSSAALILLGGAAIVLRRRR